MTYKKDCIYYTPMYTQRDKRGNPKVGSHWCVEHNGKIQKCPKICEFFTKKETR